MRAGLGQAARVTLWKIGQGRRARTIATLALVVLGPVLALATFVVLGPFDTDIAPTTIRLVLLLDLVYVLSIATLVLIRIGRMVGARRARSAGSRLHLRLTGVFAIVALLPTVLVAIFAGLTLNIGLEGWFSERVRGVVGASLAAAEAYEDEQKADLAEDTEALARFLDVQQRTSFLMSEGDFRRVLAQGQTQIQRGLREAFVIDGAGEIRARGDRSYLFDYEEPTVSQIAAAQAGETVIIPDWANNEFRALRQLDAFVDRYLLVSREVDGDLLNLLDETQSTARLYQQLERERGRMLFEFGLLYLGFAVMLVLAAIWLGLWFAERLSKPVGRLAAVAQRVGDGNLDTRVREERGDDEIAMLGRVFNQMIAQLRRQRQTLLDANAEIDDQRRLFDSVLSSITSGVLGLDADGRLNFVNPSGARLLDLPETGPGNPGLAALVPAFGPVLEELRAGNAATIQSQVSIDRGDTRRIFLVRMAGRFGADGELDGYVVAFDDVTELVSAQRLAAWGDVARRIAHEIKNPLTPIQLSAERIRRKFRPEAPAEAERLDQLTDVIVRQTGDLRRIVDEFARFARLPEPDQARQDLARIVRDAVLLETEGLPEVAIESDLPTAPLMAEVDATLLSQALINVVKNAAEAATSDPDARAPRVHVSLARHGAELRLQIDDSGPGFPADRERLFEPYVTTRERGTGLGLPIVKKIVEDHAGEIRLEASDTLGGGRVTILLPAPPEAPAEAAE